jgi:Initiator Replication protein
MGESNTAQLPLALRNNPKPTGDIWQPSVTHPATVPVPLPVVMVRVEGPFTALDRKLWLLLLHNAWDELDADKPYHEISVSELLRLFRKFGRTDLGTRGKIKFGKVEEETEAAALWDSMRRLVKTTVEWEDEDYQGISALVSEALLNKRYRERGKIYYAFGKGLSQQILAPRAFARLRCHVVLALRSKYAVTLYEILEAYVNRRESSLTVSIEEFRLWLKVPEDAYKDWKDLKRNVVLPAVDEINQHGEEGGFFVTYEGEREGKAYTRIKFTLAKSAARDDRDMKLQGKARRGRAFAGIASQMASNAPYEPTDAVLDQLRTLAPGWDRQALLAAYRAWNKGKAQPDNPHGAFIGWVKRFTKKKAED